ncbi:MAG: anti-FecI sigma factor FecR [Bacteroidetes bacterium]|nr:MAG: anti-FecI sigma factor FecR [Bacteroidota bacterium]
MNETDTYYESLMAAYFSGEATPDEIKQLSVWLTENPANLDSFEVYRQVWLMTAKDALSAGTDMEAEWKALTARMGPEAITSTPSEPAIPLRRLKVLFMSWKAAAIAAVLIAAAAAMFYLNSGPGTIVVAATGSNLEKVLPDGSVVTLYKGTEIEYPEKFGDDTREVKLNGEAYFNVTKDAERPFIVSGGNARIKVLGTTFNVNTKAGESKISVVLTSGRVALYFDGKETVGRILNPGEAAEMNTGQKSIVTNANPDPNYMAWKTGIILFENAALEEVAATLGKVYHTEVRLSGKQLSGCSLTASFEKQPLNQVLHVIGETLGLKIRQENGIVIFEGNGCN